MRPISQFMTVCPHTIPAEIHFEQALEKMKLYQVRHLAVTDGGELVGVVSENGLRVCQLLSAASGWGPKVGDICEGNPTIVAANTRVSEVADLMSKQQLDYVLVVDENELLAGIFSTVDACRYIYFLTSGE